MYDFSPEELTIVAPAHVKEISPQNAGAGRLNRARETSRDSSTFVLAAVLFSLGGPCASAGSGGADLLRPLHDGRACASVLLLAGRWISFHWRALRCQCANAAFIAYGAHFGPIGVLIGQASGSVVFGTQALITAFHVVGRLGSTVSRPGNATAIPSGTGNTALAVHPGTCPRAGARRVCDKAEALSRWHDELTARRGVPSH